MLGRKVRACSHFIGIANAHCTVRVKKITPKGSDIFHLFTNGWEFLIDFWHVPMYTRSQIFYSIISNFDEVMLY